MALAELHYDLPGDRPAPWLNVNMPQAPGVGPGPRCTCCHVCREATAADCAPGWLSRATPNHSRLGGKAKLCRAQLWGPRTVGEASQREGWLLLGPLAARVPCPAKGRVLWGWKVGKLQPYQRKGL